MLTIHRKGIYFFCGKTYIEHSRNLNECKKSELAMKKKKLFDMFPSFALFTQIGLGMAVPVILAALAGEFID